MTKPDGEPMGRFLDWVLLACFLVFVVSVGTLILYYTTSEEPAPVEVEEEFESGFMELTPEEIEDVNNWRWRVK